MGYNVARPRVNCYSCGGHNLAHTVSLLCRIPYAEAKELIGDVEKEHFHNERVQGKLMLPYGLGPLKKVHKDYLLSRDFEVSEIVRLWSVGGIGPAPSLAWRLWIPIVLHGQVVSWTTRRLGEGHANDQGRTPLRYASASAKQEYMYHKHLLYGEDYCEHCVLICEGPTDVWRIGPGAVCTFGTGFTRAQVLRASKYAVRVVCYDAEAAAQRQANKLCDQLNGFPGEVYNVILDSKDPGASGPKVIRKLRSRFLT